VLGIPLNKRPSHNPEEAVKKEERPLWEEEEHKGVPLPSEERVKLWLYCDIQQAPNCAP